MSSASGNPFSRKGAIWLAAIFVVSLLAFVFVMAWGFDPQEEVQAGADSLSRSALGHAAFVSLLEELDIPVSVSRHASGRRAGDRAALVVAEPRLEAPEDEERLEEMLAEAGAVLLVLPKWRCAKERRAADRADGVWERGPYEVKEVLKAADIEATPVRIAAAEAVWEPTSLFPEPPELPFPQLLVSGGMTPLIDAGGRILLGEVRRDGRRILVLSDPDLLSNHGLRRGDNAVLAARIVDDLREGAKPVLVDATMHGRIFRPSIWRELFRFPLLLGVLQGVLVLGLILWVATGRFGTPPPPAPAVEPGKGVLIENTARLLAFGGHSKEALRRYLRFTADEVAQTFHAPAGLSREALARFLDRLGERRGTVKRFSDLAREVREVRGTRGREAGQVVRAAARIHAYRREILDGSGKHPRRD